MTNEFKKSRMLYQPVKVCTEKDYAKTWQEVHEANEKHLEYLEDKAIKTGGMLYRFLYEAVADGKAIYQIIKINKTTVRVRLCSMDGLYNDYVVPQWGTEATIPLSYAQNQIRFQDMWRNKMKERGN